MDRLVHGQSHEHNLYVPEYLDTRHPTVEGGRTPTTPMTTQHKPTCDHSHTKFAQIFLFCSNMCKWSHYDVLQSNIAGLGKN